MAIASQPARADVTRSGLRPSAEPYSVAAPTQGIAPAVSDGAGSAPAAEHTPRTALFDTVPPTFFAPLAAPSGALNAEVLQRLCEAEYESVRGVLIKDDAWSITQDVRARSPLWQANRPQSVAELGDDAPVAEDESEDAVRRPASKYTVQRLHACGWFHFDYRSDLGGEVVSFFLHASRILTTIVRVARGEQLILEGYTHDIFTMLEGRTFARNLGVASLATVSPAWRRSSSPWDCHPHSSLTARGVLHA